MELMDLPTPALTSLQREMNRLWDDFFSFRGRGGNGATTIWHPEVDVEETPENVVIRVDLPGVDPKNIDVNVKDRHLTISGERTEARTDEQGHTWTRCERPCGRFERTLLLPAPVDDASAKATDRHGVVTITLQKTKEAQLRRIPVKAG